MNFVLPYSQENLWESVVDWPWLDTRWSPSCSISPLLSRIAAVQVEKVRWNKKTLGQGKGSLIRQKWRLHMEAKENRFILYFPSTGSVQPVEITGMTLKHTEFVAFVGSVQARTELATPVPPNTKLCTQWQHPHPCPHHSQVKRNWSPQRSSLLELHEKEPHTFPSWLHCKSTPSTVHGHQDERGTPWTPLCWSLLLPLTTAQAHCIFGAQSCR